MTPQTLFSNASKSFQRGKYTDALASLNKLLDVSRDVKTYMLLAKTLKALKMPEEAARTLVMAAELGGSRSEDFYAEAMRLYYENGNEDLALSLGRPLLERARKDADVAFIITKLFMKRGLKDMVRVFLPVLSTSTDVQHNGLALQLLTGAPENAQDRETVANLWQRLPRSYIIMLAHLVFRREVNDFEEMERLQPQLDRMLDRNSEQVLRAESPFYNLHWLADERLNKIAGYNPGSFPKTHAAERLTMPHTWGDKIRIGYLSSDLWKDHATMKLLGAVLELHDRSKFDITLFCHTKDSHLQKGDFDRSVWGKVVPVRDMSDEQAAQTIRDHQIDILVEMKGHTMGSRAKILNHKAAPVQIAWLGFPGTTSNVDLDYVIGDHYVLPDHSKPHYWEKFCRMPECYQPNDPFDRPRRNLFTRADANLPEDAFVFGSFNATRKISLSNIDLWARILNATPDSILWLMCKTNDARDNILNRLKKDGIDPKRIVFTKFVTYEEHLARLTLADVGLDTFPVNGHTTTSEQLWAGLPVLTMKGTHFASRVSESLLRAIDLPEMIAEDEEDYFQRAVDLYQNRDKVKTYQAKLEQNRLVKPLFDAERFCRHLESGYQMMAERARKGLSPNHIDVPALPPRSEPFLVETNP
ncbi:glycosyltransferase family 41 protein [Rhizobium sp. FY34]|uniref:O-linked N-acetylglucosamine transferase, SPINDLY family protein n=1 Tax=Rhizobium sp. FY34 TaxID=2562309 RepID=UPI0010C0FCE2|nr:glycosyltransferase family 41 protein [Rhizobium sp. FY34]